MSNQPQAQSSTNSYFGAFDCAIVVLICSRFFLPTEAVEQGHTLWIASLWILLWMLRSWMYWRDQNASIIKLTYLDIAVCCLVGGHLLSGSVILFDQGDKRAALNYMWEWVALGVMYLHAKQLLLITTRRQILLQSIIITALSLSCLGLWQHFVWYRVQSAAVAELFELHDQQTTNTLNPAQRTKYNKLAGEFGADVLTLNETGRKMFLARVNSSREPIGRFALANTFAGLLCCVTALFIASRCLDWRQLSRKQLLITFIMSGLLLTCLLLTKSRTALLGLCVSMGAFAVSRMSYVTMGRKQWKLALIFGLVLFALVAVLTLAGGLDYEVLSEAPKSLQYRVEYWTATFNMLKDSSLFGVGPGNFRQHYLQYKLPGSSEEILDPHNLFLDVWANGGCLALIGLMGIIGLFDLLTLPLSKRSLKPVEAGCASAITTGRISTKNLLVIGACTGGLVLGYEYLLLGITDTVMFVTWLGWVLFALVVVKSKLWLTESALVFICAGLALTTNLLAAGGIGMPAITQLFLIFALLSRPQAGELKSFNIPSVFPLLTSLLLLIFILWTALVPQIYVSNLLEIGQQELVVRNQPQRAIKTFTEATLSDSLNPAPWQQLANARLSIWSGSGKRNEELFKQVVEAQLSSIQRDPLSPNRHRSLGEFWLAKYKNTADLEDAKQAVAAFQQAADLYPTSSAILAQLAIAQSDFNDNKAILKQAKQNAQSALDLDALNQKSGHTDKLLESNTRQQLQDIAGNE